MPDAGSDALLEYCWASRCDLRLFHFVIDLALRDDFVVHIARQALEGKDGCTADTPLDLVKTNPGRSTQALRQSKQELLEMFTSRAVDNFEVYLVALIRQVLHKEPRILADRKQELTLGHILKFESIEALTREIIEGKLNTLSYQGFAELETWCTQRLIPLVVPHGQRDKLVELIALRNIIVHSRGRVDERYRAAVPTSSVQLGDKRELDADDLFEAISLLDTVVLATDAAVSAKFKLASVKVREELQVREAKRWPKLEKHDGEPIEPPKSQAKR